MFANGTVSELNRFECRELTKKYSESALVDTQVGKNLDNTYLFVT